MAATSEPVVCIKNTFIDLAKCQEEDLPRASSQVGDEASEGSTAATAGADAGHNKKVAFEDDEDVATPTSTSSLCRTVTYDGYEPRATGCQDLLGRPTTVSRVVAPLAKDDLELERQDSLDRTTTYDGFEDAMGMCMEPIMAGEVSSHELVHQRIHAGWGPTPVATTAAAAHAPATLCMPTRVTLVAPAPQPTESQKRQRARPFVPSQVQGLPAVPAVDVRMERKTAGEASSREAVDQRVHAGWGSTPAPMKAVTGSMTTATAQMVATTRGCLPTHAPTAAPSKQRPEAQTRQRAGSPGRMQQQPQHLMQPPQEMPKQRGARQPQDLSAVSTQGVSAASVPWKGLGLERLSAPGAVVQRFRWVVDAEMLTSSERKAVSPSFNVFFSGPVQFRPLRFEMFIHAQAGDDTTGSTSFKKAKGRGCLELKCLQLFSGNEALPVRFRFAVGSLPPRGPARHDFSAKAVCGLPNAEAEWDFTAEVDPRSRSFAVLLEIVAGSDTQRDGVFGSSAGRRA